MKQIICSAMAGEPTCDFVIKGENAQEMIANGWAHMQAVHPELAKKIESNPKEEHDKWMADFAAKFDTLADA